MQRQNVLSTLLVILLMASVVGACAPATPSTSTAPAAQEAAVDLSAYLPGAIQDGPPIQYTGAGAGQTGDLPSTGEINILVVLTQAKDKVPPSNNTDARDKVVQTFDQVKEFYSQASYNRLTLNITVTNGWQPLSGNYADYVFLTGKGSPNIYRNVLPRLWAEAAKAAQDDNQKLDDFNIMAVVLFGNGQELRAWGGESKSTFQYDQIKITTTHELNLMAISDNADWGRCVHEVAHNIIKGNPVMVQGEDVYQSDLVDKTAATADLFDMMGSHDTHPLFSGHLMYQLNWYSSDNIVDDLKWSPDPASQEYEIVAHGLTEDTDPNRYHLVRLKVTVGLYYYVEVRQRPDPNQAPLALFDKEIPVEGVLNNGGVVVTKVLIGTVHMNQQTRFITLLHEPRVLKEGETAIDPARNIKFTVVDEDVVTRPLTSRIRIEWGQTMPDNPQGTFDLRISPWDASYQTDDIWIDRNPFDVYDDHDGSGNPLGNGDKPRPMEINHFWGRIHNDGTTAVNNIALTFYSISPPGVGDNGNWTSLTTKTIPEISANSQKDVPANWVPEVGKHTCLRIVASQQVGEISGGNNMAQENVFKFEAPASSQPAPVTIPFAVRNPLDRQTIVLLSIRGLPENYTAELSNQWVWLEPKAEKLVTLTVQAPSFDFPGTMPIPATIYVSGYIPHWYEDTTQASVMLPLGGFQAQVIPKMRVTLTLEEDKESNANVADPANTIVLRGKMTPLIADQPVIVYVWDPAGQVRWDQTLTDNVGEFQSSFDLHKAPVKDFWASDLLAQGQWDESVEQAWLEWQQQVGVESENAEETAEMLPGEYSAQAVIINAPAAAETGSDVVKITR